MAAVTRTESHAIDDMEKQPPPPPAAPTMRMDMVPSPGAMIGWTYSPAEAATLSITGWEAQWGFPVMGGWEDLPTTAEDSQEGEDADMLFMKVTTFDVVKEWRASVSGLEAGAWYVFRVRAVNETGSGAWSEASVALCLQPDETIAMGRPGLSGYLPEWVAGSNVTLGSMLGRQDELKTERDAAAAEVAALAAKIEALEAAAAAAAQPAPARADI